ncbi:UPF0149 family protein [Consotaella aegiceratis]|uniref:UPF0149 family protein n=1 Tax=Consotaella aegiceratis TaxID=3097961 RepID=UPI002F3FA519
MMADEIPRHAKLLDKHLSALLDRCEPMLLSELDGFLAGIIVCPDMIMPGEWLRLVWNTEGDDEAEPVFENEKEANKLIRLVMEHYNSIVTELNEGRYSPILDYDLRHDETMWELWASGFGKAMALRLDSWKKLAAVKDDVGASVSMLVHMTVIAEGESNLPDDEADGLTRDAPDLIPPCVQMLYDHRMSVAGPDPNSRLSQFDGVGRNDPCPCGSGKKFKKCHGMVH